MYITTILILYIIKESFFMYLYTYIVMHIFDISKAEILANFLNIFFMH